MSEPVIAIIDVETTGVNPERDRVIEFAVQKGLEAGEYQQVWLVNPEIPIPKAASAIHGITDDRVKDAPPFRALLPKINKILLGADIIVGYNVDFDLRCIAEEFRRCGEKAPDLSTKMIVDPLKIWRHFEPRRLEDALKRFCGESHTTAHSAAGDVEATGKVLRGMLCAFGVDQLSWKELENLMEPERASWIGPSNHLKWENEEVIINFGKNRGKDLHSICRDDNDYLSWLIKSDFPPHIKELVAEARSKGKADFVEWVVEKYGRV